MMADEPDNGGGGLELPGAFGRRIGPLPLGAWVGAGVAGLVLAYVWNKRRGASEGTSAGDETATNPQTADASAPAYLPTSFAVAGGGPGATGSTGTTTTTAETVTGTTPAGYATNSEWRRAAVTALTAKGYSPIVADDALARYLESQDLTAQQSGLVGIALQTIGPAPDPVPASPAPPPDPTQPASQPTPVTAAPAPAAPAPGSWKPAWLQGVRFVKGSGPATYLVTDNGLEWVPSEGAFIALGGGGTLADADGRGNPYTWSRNPNGTPPVVIPDSALAALPKVGTSPP